MPGADRLGLEEDALFLHEDMRAHFRAYPPKWGLSAPDANIDHRRVPNLMTFFERHGSRDEGHAGDASMLFAVSSGEDHFAAAEVEVMLDLDYRTDLNDQWMACFERERVIRS